MTDWPQRLLAQYPVRNTAEQKTAFRAELLRCLQAQGFQARVEENGRTCQQNVVIGDPAHAPILFTAHYDTPAWNLLPDVRMPLCWPVWVLYQLAHMALLLLPPLAVYVLVWQLTRQARLGFACLIVVYVALLLCTRYGPANRRNANTSSGLLAALELLAGLSPEAAGSAAVLVADGGERGHAGVRAWCKAHLQIQYTRLTVGLDCLGTGDTLVCASTPLARKSTGYAGLIRALSAVPGLTLREVRAGASTQPGDFRAFRCGVGLTCGRRLPLLGPVAGRLRTARDTAADPAQVRRAAQALADAAGRWTADRM